VDKLASRSLVALALVLSIAVVPIDVVDAAPKTSNGWTTSASAPSTVARGGQIAVTISVRSTSSRRARIFGRIVRADGRRIKTTEWPSEYLTGGRTRTFTMRWNVPGDARLTSYSVRVGISRPAGGPLAHWNPSADSFGVVAPHGGHIPPDQLPKGNPLYADSRVLLTKGPVSGSTGTDSGNFRQSCEFSHMNYDDPIVHPGNPGAAHLHSFFGNTSVNHASTHASLTAAGKKSTCSGAAANLSAYWTPTMMNGARPIAPSGVGVYYKSRNLPASTLANIPRGLKMVAGNMSSLTGQASHIVFWECVGDPYKVNTTIPSCPAGRQLGMLIQFPQCWDGVHLDSPDHISHVRYADWNRGCSVHPRHRVPLPQLTIITHWRVPAGGSGNLRLSSDRPGARRGASGHADYMEGWNRRILARWSQSCLREGRDTTNSLCDGGHLVMPHQFEWYR